MMIEQRRSCRRRSRPMIENTTARCNRQASHHRQHALSPKVTDRLLGQREWSRAASAPARLAKRRQSMPARRKIITSHDDETRALCAFSRRAGEVRVCGSTTRRAAPTSEPGSSIPSSRPAPPWRRARSSAGTRRLPGVMWPLSKSEIGAGNRGIDGGDDEDQKLISRRHRACARGHLAVVDGPQRAPSSDLRSS